MKTQRITATLAAILLAMVVVKELNAGEPALSPRAQANQIQSATATTGKTGMAAHCQEKTQAAASDSCEAMKGCATMKHDDKATTTGSSHNMMGGHMMGHHMSCCGKS